LTPLERVSIEAQGCTRCAPHLPLGPRPIFRASASARLLIISQAPGTKAHESGMTFNDASGDRLRQWLGISRDVFYDYSRIAIMPMGFCYPGVLINGGDAAPRRECAPLWHARFLPLMPAVKLTLLVGGHAQLRYLGPGTMTSRVANFAAHPGYFALPHPSWRTIGWERRNPWFADTALPALQAAVAALL
jgi:uracil-DNA glycosylase